MRHALAAVTCMHLTRSLESSYFGSDLHPAGSAVLAACAYLDLGVNLLTAQLARAHLHLQTVQGVKLYQRLTFISNKGQLLAQAHLHLQVVVPVRQSARVYKGRSRVIGDGCQHVHSTNSRLWHRPAALT